jgi:hypothetical protein
VRFQPALCEQIAVVLSDEFDRREAGDRRLLQTQTSRVTQLERQKQKLIDAYLADALDTHDLRPRQEAINQELADARRLITSAQTRHDEIREHLDIGLKVLEQADRLYAVCDEDKRATLNLAAFEALYINTNDNGEPYVAEVALNPEFASLIEVAATQTSWQPQPTSCGHTATFTNGRRTYARQPAQHAQTNTAERWTLNEVQRSHGSNLTYLAERVGFEPTEGCPSHAFQACRFGRSRTSPGWLNRQRPEPLACSALQHDIVCTTPSPHPLGTRRVPTWDDRVLCDRTP